jgi:alkyldihydroxyacetonephosphate synthase
VPKPIVNQEFVAAIQGQGKISFDDAERLHRSHEIYALRHGSIQRVPDAVVWPECHEHVERIVALAQVILESRCRR